MLGFLCEPTVNVLTPTTRSISTEPFAMVMRTGANSVAWPDAIKLSASAVVIDEISAPVSRIMSVGVEPTMTLTWMEWPIIVNGTASPPPGDA